MNNNPDRHVTAGNAIPKPVANRAQRPEMSPPDSLPERVRPSRPTERPERKPTTPHLANQLNKMIENLDAYISERAFKMASKRITEAEAAAQARIAEVERDAMVERQRSADLIAELRRQMAAGHRRADLLQRQVNDARQMDSEHAGIPMAPKLRLEKLLRNLPPAGRLSDYGVEPSSPQ